MQRQNKLTIVCPNGVTFLHADCCSIELVPCNFISSCCSCNKNRHHYHYFINNVLTPPDLCACLKTGPVLPSHMLWSLSLQIVLLRKHIFKVTRETCLRQNEITFPEASLFNIICAFCLDLFICFIIFRSVSIQNLITNKLTLARTHGAIKNGQSRDTDNIGNARHKTKTNETHKKQTSV